MDVSVIIPTYQGADRIRKTLASLVEQQFKDFEVVVVIDGSTDDTKSCIALFDNKLQIVVVEQSNQGRAGAKNAGIKNSNGNLLIFMDDDIRFDQGIISMHVAHHASVHSSVLVGGAVEDPRVSITEFHEYKAFKSRLWNKSLHSYPHPMPRDMALIVAANFSVSKSLIEQVGLFNPLLRDSEDEELTLRVSSSGFDIYFNDKLAGWHDDLMDPYRYVGRLRSFASHHSSQREILKSIPLPKRYVFRLLKFPIWLRAINKGYFLWLPKKIRYRLYDAIFTAHSMEL